MPTKASIALSLDSDTTYSEPAFLQLIRTHATYLRQQYQQNTLQVTEHDAFRFRGNFTGLMRLKNISPRLGKVIAIINGIDNPLWYDGEQTIFIVPPESEINLLWQRDHTLDSELT